MKKTTTFFLFLIIAFTSQAQDKMGEVCNCPEPEKNEYYKVCSYSRDKKRAIEPCECTFLFEQQIMKIYNEF